MATAPVAGSAHRSRTAPPLRLESIREPVADGTTEARVAAMSRAMGQLAARIAMEIRDVLASLRTTAPGRPVHDHHRPVLAVGHWIISGEG